MKKSELKELIREVLSEYNIGKAEDLVGKTVKNVIVKNNEITFEFNDNSSILIYTPNSDSEISYRAINVVPLRTRRMR